jgi:prevent-host-death family protein
VTVVNMHEAKTHLSRLVERVSQGEEIVIARAGQPVARLVRIERDLTPRPFGTMRGLIEIADDFDAPLPDDLLAAFQDEVGPA